MKIESVRMRLINLLGNLWASPTTLIGLTVAFLTVPLGTRLRRRDGAIEAYGRPLDVLLRRFVPLPGGASALTLGHVILGRSDEVLRRHEVHERVHVRQARRWGVFFIPAYLGAALAVWIRGGHPYYDNPFEIEARAGEQAGG